MREFVVASAVLMTVGCQSVDLTENAFVGTWDCDDVAVTMTDAMVTVDGTARSIAYIEQGGNADYGLTATDGTRYSIFNTTRRSLTLFAHADRDSFACTRTG